MTPRGRGFSQIKNLFGYGLEFSEQTKKSLDGCYFKVRDGPIDQTGTGDRASSTRFKLHYFSGFQIHGISPFLVTIAGYEFTITRAPKSKLESPDDAVNRFIWIRGPTRDVSKWLGQVRKIPWIT